jgi:predicted PurR-regulated permease PerM
VTDNVLRPYLISRGSDLPLILILFGVVGGAVAFGVLGLFLGPTLLAVGYELIREWNAAKSPGAQPS